MRVAVIGLGYVGLVQAVGLASLGHEILGIDINAEKVASLLRGEMPFFEPGLAEALEEQKGRIRFESNWTQLTEFGAEIVLICTPTPARADGSCETRFVEDAVRQVGEYVCARTLVVIKSTVPPGGLVTFAGAKETQFIELASCPEFLREGNALSDFAHPDRIVLGVESAWAENLLRAMHAGIDAPIFVMSIKSAQLSKYASNTMLATRLSFMNELANIADAIGADIQDIEKVIGSDARIGSAFLRAGAGFGGSCFPKDVLALSAVAQEAGYETRIIRPIIDINKDQPHRFVQKIETELGESLKGKTCAIWGLAFNANTDDIRESPAIKVIEILLEKGAILKVYDPRAIENAKRVLGNRVQYATSAQETLETVDILCILTEWPEFSKIDWSEIAPYIASKRVFDGKNFLPRERIQEVGLLYCGIGICNEHSHDPGN